ncbi:GNAT family N-acetyltransferase [Polaromonas sp.]|uniref:GNAT family N-acetyltransferase n=1 Tax=Polaromonas sp. TaxID=1869339 RepID=UPI00286CC9F0|nr:GNAT family N-acetyltransferase [Polaromonas sp.]
MVKPGTLLKASLEAGREFFRPPLEERPVARPETAVTTAAAAEPVAPYVRPLMVPIRSIGPSHGERIAAHLLALNAHDRYLRFGYAANDEQIRRYVDGLNFERDEIFGIYNRRLELIAMAHLAFSTNPELKSCAEFGVSVLAGSRGRGYGARLFERAEMHARNEGVDMMFIHALSENTAMLNIARKAGATIERDGSESEAYLKLPPADLDSRMTEIVEEQVAQTDYRLKMQAKQFWEILAVLQEVRRGVRESRDRMHG